MKTLACLLCLLLAAEPPTGVLTKPPVLKHQVEAQYPAEALAQQLEGTVVMLIDISETGAVTEVQVTQPAGHGFDEAAVAAVRQFEFEPAEVDNVPAPVRIEYAYQFLWRAPPPAEGTGAEQAPEAPVNFSGRALERGTRRPLNGAEVALPGLQLTTSTDEEGRFSFRGVPAGTHEVLVVLSGYDRFRTRESISEDQETQATYYVHKRIFSQFETVVRSERERKEVTRTTLQLAEVQKVAGTQGDTLKVVQNLPGVARPAFNGGQLVIRGTSPNDSGVFLDGQRIPLLYHFGGLTSVYNSDLLEALDYLPGNFSSYYGNVTGGVINVRSRAPKMDGFHGTAGVSVIESNAMLEGPLTENLGIAVAGRRSYADAVLKLVPEDEDRPSIRVAPRYYDAQLKLHWTPLPRHTFTLQGLTSNDVLGLLFERPVDRDPSINGKFNITTGFSQLRLGHQYKEGNLTLDSQALVGNTLLEFILGERFLRISGVDFGVRSTAEYSVSEALTVAGGLDIDYSRASVKARFQSFPREGEPPRPVVTEEILSTDTLSYQYFPGVWAEARWRPLEGLLLVPGVRLESYLFEGQRVNKRSLNPRLAVRYALTEQVTVKGGAGLYHAPPINEEPDSVFGNPELKAKRSYQYSVGSEWQPAPGYFLSGELFYNDLHRLIVRSNRQVERGGQRVPERLANGGTGRIYGFELLARRALTERFFGWVAYTFSRSQRRDGPEAPLRLFDNDQTHVLTVIGSYKLPAGWEVGARFRFSTGNPITPITGARRDDLTDVFIPSFGPVNSRRLPDFHQLDVRVDKNFVFEKWLLNVYVDLTNAYNNPGKEGLLYNYNYSESAFLEGLPILPIIGVKGTF